MAEEKHKDGSPHLHAFIKVDRPMRFKKDRFDLPRFDGKAEKYHANIQPARSIRAVLKYCSKDGNFITNVNLDSYLKKKGKLTFEDLEKPILELARSGAISPYQWSSIYHNQCTYKMLLKQEKELPEEMLGKKRHFWIYGATNTGKTTHLRKLMKNVGVENVFQIPYNNGWVGYNDEMYLIADEYRGQLTIQELNRICDGGAKVNVKGGSVQLEYNVIVIICSNYSMSRCYGNVAEDVIETLRSRFNEIVLPYTLPEDVYDNWDIETILEQTTNTDTLSKLELFPKFVARP